MRSTVQSRSPNYQKYKTQRESSQRQKISNSLCVDKQISLTDTTTLKLELAKLRKNLLLLDDILKSMLGEILNKKEKEKTRMKGLRASQKSEYRKILQLKTPFLIITCCVLSKDLSNSRVGSKEHLQAFSDCKYVGQIEMRGRRK